MTSKEARNFIYEWVQAHGVSLDGEDGKPREELKKLIIQYEEVATKIPTKHISTKAMKETKGSTTTTASHKEYKEYEFHTPKSFG